MNKLILLFTLLILSSASYGAAYFGGSYGYSMFSSATLKEYQVSPKGSSYGGFVGYGKDLVGVEGFYQSFSTKGDIEHDGESQTLTTNANAMGLALRFSFELMYFRLGSARYVLNQSTDITDANSRAAADDIYDVQKNGTTKNGLMYGMGLHHKFSWIRVFFDFTRYQINAIGSYDTFSVGLSFPIPDKLFNIGKN